MKTHAFVIENVVSFRHFFKKLDFFLSANYNVEMFLSDETPSSAPEEGTLDGNPTERRNRVCQD